MPLPEQLTVLNGKSLRSRGSIALLHKPRTGQLLSANPVLVVNLLLAGLFILLLFAYIIQMNVVTSKSYTIKILNDKISTLNETNSILSVSKASIDDINLIMEYAIANNMVKGDGSVALYNEAGVAMKR